MNKILWRLAWALTIPVVFVLLPFLGVIAFALCIVECIIMIPRWILTGQWGYIWVVWFTDFTNEYLDEITDYIYERALED